MFHVKHDAAPTRTPPGLGHLHAELEGLRAAGLLRDRPGPLSTPFRSFCSNDYLGLAVDPNGSAIGAGASRLVSGERDAHLLLEQDVAAWLGTEAALAFTSGYAANVGTVGALARAGDLVVSDALNHASLIDGCRLSRARVEVVPHLDVGAVERALARPLADPGGRRWVLTESYFGMDADVPDLRALRQVSDAHGAALLVDEAHALGVLGPGGRGLCAEAGIEPDVLVGTFGKAFGQAGAFVAGCEALVLWLWNRARSFVFSTGMSPLVAVAVREALVTAAGADAARRRVADLAERLRRELLARGVSPLGRGHVVPVVVGDARRAVAAARALVGEGLHVQAIRPPTVPEASSRLRLSVTARHTPEEIDALAEAVARAVRP